MKGIGISMNSFDFKSLKTSSSNKNNFTNASALSKSSSTASINSPSNNTQLSNIQTLIKGQIIKAEVIDLRGKDIKIQLNNSEIISGKINSDVPLSIGEQVTFQVEDASLTSISLKVMADNRLSSQSIIVDKALEDANLPKTEKSIQLVQELLNNQMSIDKESLQKLYQQSITFKNASIQTLVFMNKYGIELNDINTTQFEAYQNFEHRLIYGSDALLNTILDVLSQTSNEVATKLNQLLLGISTRPFSSPFGMVMNEYSQRSASMARDETATFIHNPMNQGNTNEMSTPFINQEILDSHFAYEELNQSNIKDSLLYRESLQPNEERSLSSRESLQRNIGLSLSSRASLQSNVEHAINLGMDSNLYSTLTVDSSSMSISNLLNDADKNTLIHVLPSELQNVLAEKFKDSSCTTLDVVSIINDHVDSFNSAQLQALIKTPVYHSILKEAIMSQWTLTPNALKSLTSIDKFYEQLEADFKELADFFNTTTKESFDQSFENASKQAKNLQENIDFMKTLNQLFPYVQLPMKLSNQNVHSELYVYKRKKEANQESNNVSVLLHLDMEQLGPLDIHLDLLKTNINTKIYTESKDSKFLFDANIGLLKSALENKGYSFSYEIIKRVKDTDLVQEIKKNSDPIIGMKRYSFDIRA